MTLLLILAVAICISEETRRALAANLTGVNHEHSTGRLT